jgi:hypothetical protein
MIYRLRGCSSCCWRVNDDNDFESRQDFILRNGYQITEVKD